MKTIAIITAMESEFNAVQKLYAFTQSNGIAEAEVYGKKILLIKSGIGKVNAALASAKAFQHGADMLITTGLAGGIDASLIQGDIVLADRVCYHDVWCESPNPKGQVQDMPLYYEASSDVLRCCIEAASAGYFRMGLTVTGDQFLTDPQRLKEIKTDFPDALAVDMESAAIAQACYVYNKPYLSLRIISDVVGKMGQVEQYEAFWQNVPHKASEMIDKVLKCIEL